MLKRATKFLFILGFSVVFWMAILLLAKADPVFAYYNDIENSLGNVFRTGVLDFSLFSPQDFLPAEICPSETAFREIELLNLGNPFNYQIETTEISGDLCEYINLEAYLDGGQTECAGPLTSFNCQGLTFSDPSGSPAQQWHFKAILTEGAPEESVCNFKFFFSGRQLNLETGGFYDEEEIESTISSGICLAESPKVIINKVYFNVDSAHGSDPTNEWLELYNPNDFSVDISGWIIEDNHAQDIIPSSSVIPGQDFVLISGDASTRQYWETIPVDVLKIVLPDNKIGNGLANLGDRVILKDLYGREIDAVSWGTDKYAFDPSAPAVAKGHILARVLTGIDTNTAADWKDLGLPQVTVTYPTGGSWYCGGTYDIKWTAINPNGPDNDLKITLLYIRDLDRNGVVSDNDAVTTIAQDITNTGTYNWTVLPCYLGYVWIKVIAQGPENFMVSGSGLSGRVYEPDSPEGEDEAQEMDCLYSELGECLSGEQSEQSSEEVGQEDENAIGQELTTEEEIEEIEEIEENEENQAREPESDVGAIQESPAEEPLE